MSAQPARTLDLAQLTLPQLAVAVATGDVPRADAEAELERRPAPDVRRRPVRPRPTRSAAATEWLKAVEEARREVRQTRRQLVALDRRLESLARLASGLLLTPRRA